jgi:two-component system sensor histidine kinase RpfC
LAAILEAAGHYVTMETDGDEALAELKKGKFDILLLDVNMPRLNGLDACMMWRQSESGQSHLPIIGVTADATAETEAKCLHAGMDLRITKPVNAQLLLATIEHYCADGSLEPLSTDRIHPSNRDVVVPISRDAVPAGDVIDGAQIQYLRSIGDQAFVNTMIDGFLEDIGQTLEPLQCAVKSGDVAEFRFCAHALKSSGNNMGARSLSRLCGPLEKISEVDLAQNGLEYLAQIEKEITRTVAALKTDFYTGEVPAIAKTG